MPDLNMRPEFTFINDGGEILTELIHAMSLKLYKWIHRVASHLLVVSSEYVNIVLTLSSTPSSVSMPSTNPHHLR